jgi:NTP pyrophosphatase (non-canonical NTP hydrolase)
VNAGPRFLCTCDCHTAAPGTVFHAFPCCDGEESPPAVDVRQMQASIHQWAETTFPGRPVHSALVKLFEEIGEVIKEPSKEEEWADVMILWLDLAAMHGVDIAGAVMRKMQINRQRRWAVDANGLMSHVKD